MMDPEAGGLYVVFAVTLAFVGFLVAVAFGIWAMRRGKAVSAGGVDFAPWARKLRLTYDADARGTPPSPRLYGTLDGYAVQVLQRLEGARTIDVFVESPAGRRWPEASDEPQRAKLVQDHPQLGPLLADVQASHAAHIDAGRVVCSLAVPHEHDPQLRIRVDGTLRAAVALARALDAIA